MVTAELDLARVEQARGWVPSLTHDRPFAPPQPQPVSEPESEPESAAGE